MTSPILVAYDPDNHDHSPVTFGALLSGLTGAPLLVASVFSGGPVLDRLAGGTFWNELGADAGQALEHLRAELLEAHVGTDIRTELVEAASAAAGLDTMIDSERPWLAVFGSSHGGPELQARPGRTVNHVLHGGRCPIAVVPRAYRAHALETVGAGVTRTVEGRNALLAAAALASRADARLRVLAVEHHDIDGATDTLGARALDTAGEAGEAESEMVLGDPADGLAAASASLDVLVMGPHGYGRQEIPFAGSVVHRVLTTARCPVVVLPDGTSEHALSALGDTDARSSRRRTG
jgi:nucleotide-binding universal stress UspA family protein